MERKEGVYSLEKRREVFEEWCKRAKEFLRPGQSKNEYWIEFVNAYAKAKYPKGSSAIPCAWALAKSELLPPEASQFAGDQEFQLLVGLCFQLQKMAGADPFYLACRTCQLLFDHENHVKSARWLNALCELGVLKEVEKGAGARASRYRYISQPPATDKNGKANPDATVLPDPPQPVALPSSGPEAVSPNGQVSYV